MDHDMVECPECGARFSNGRGLNGHLRMKHQITGEEFQEKLQAALVEAEERKEETLDIGVKELRGLMEQKVHLELLMNHSEDLLDTLRDLEGDVGGFSRGIDLVEKFRRGIEDKWQKSFQEIIGSLEVESEREDE